jgi:hypothetical protein
MSVLGDVKEAAQTLEERLDEIIALLTDILNAVQANGQ